MHVYVAKKTFTTMNNPEVIDVPVSMDVLEYAFKDGVIYSIANTAHAGNDESVSSHSSHSSHQTEEEACHDGVLPVFVCDMNDAQEENEFLYFFRREMFTRSHIFVKLSPVLMQRIKVPHPNKDAHGFVIVHENGTNTTMIPLTEEQVYSIKHVCLTRQLVKHLVTGKVSNASNVKQFRRYKNFRHKRSRFAPLS